ADLASQLEDAVVRDDGRRFRRLHTAVVGPLDDYRDDRLEVDRRRRAIRVHLPGFAVKERGTGLASLLGRGVIGTKLMLGTDGLAGTVKSTAVAAAGRGKGAATRVSRAGAPMRVSRPDATATSPGARVPAGTTRCSTPATAKASGPVSGTCSRTCDPTSAAPT